jgi:hybrid cluster-associated redox disulfide protein
MGVSRFVGSFLQSSLFGGTWEDLAFEVQVLKAELSRLHERMDREVGALEDRIVQLEGKPGRRQGRGRLGVMTAADQADAEADAGEPPPEPQASTDRVDRSAATATTVHGSMTIAAAHGIHARAPEVFAEHHLPGCLHCALSENETIDQGAGEHGLNVQSLIADLNSLVHG